MITPTLWYQFRLWNMQSEAFRFEKSFEHSPKPSKYQLNTVVNDFHVKQMTYSRTYQNEFWPVLQYVKEYPEINDDVRFTWNILKWWVFDDLYICHFLCFYIFCKLLVFFFALSSLQNILLFGSIVIMKGIIQIKGEKFVSIATATRILNYANRNSIDDLIRRGNLNVFKVDLIYFS